MHKLVRIIICSVFGLAFLVTPCFAMTYNNDFPDYVPYAGGAYIEVESSSFQKCTLVFPINSQKNSISFLGSSNSDIVNITNSTINGYLYTSTGTQYTFRMASLSGVEYRTNSYPYDWNDLDITQILNTNVVFEDLTDLNRQNDNPYFSTFEKVCLTFGFIAVLLLLLRLIVLPFRKGVKA